MAFFANGPGVYGNWGHTPDTSGLDFIATLFLRSDTPTGVGTPAWSAPPAMWQALLNEIRRGRIVVTDPQAWQMLAERIPGTTPQSVGGAALNSPTGLAGTAGGGAGGTDSDIQDYYATLTANAQAMQAAQLAYQDWMMRTQDDAQAFAQAQQTYENTWNEQMFGYQQQKDQWALQQSAGYFEVNGQRTPTLAGIAQEAGLTGRYNGAPTFAREQYETSTMQNLLGLQAQLRGPQNYSQYLKVLGSTPQGMRDVVNAAAGRFQMPSTSGVTPGQQTRPADVQGLVNDVATGGANAQQEWAQALSGGLPNPNQFNLRNYTRMAPTQQAMLMSAYEGEGWEPADVQHMIQQSSPVGTGGQTGSFRF
jgi:hypothetical protein